MTIAANDCALLNIIVEHELLSHEQAQAAAINSTKQHRPFLSFLIDHALIDANEFAAVCCQAFSMPLMDLSTFDLTLLPRELLNQKRITQHCALPLYINDHRLYIAVADPTNYLALEEFQFNAGMRTDAILVSETQLQATINQLFSSQNNPLPFTEFEEQELASIEVDNTLSTSLMSHTTEYEDQPIVLYINKLLMEAIAKGASDLHFEPYENTYRVRFRIDGILQEVGFPPTNIAARLAARLKIMAHMDIAEKRLPQDGKIQFTISSHKSVEFRVSSLPTLFGEKIVLRMLDSSIATIGIEMLGFGSEQRAIYETHLNKPQGMILVTGPTGSGKTVSLYTGLHILNTPERNIATAEDPVEIYLTGINQVQIHPKAGLDFSSLLKAFLRQYPDVIMVGEIRDLSTAEIAIKAAQTGHLVLSTLHTNCASATIARLIYMGIAGYNLASSISLIIAHA